MSPYARRSHPQEEKMMANTVLFTTTTANTYCHSCKINRFLLTHPVLDYLFKLEKQGIDAANWLQNFNAESLEIEGRGVFSRKEVEYYVKKYLLLSENGYLDNLDIKEKTSGRLSAQAILSELANAMQVIFEMTESCNLQCEYCGYRKFYTGNKLRNKKNLSFATAKNLLDYLGRLWNSNLNRSHNKQINLSFYGGEPLLNFPLVKSLVEYANGMKLRHNRFNFSMTTNGLLLEKCMDFLVKHDFSLLISLDGDEAQNGYRVFPGGKPAFQAILKNVRALKEKYPAYFEKSVNFNAVLHNKNSVAGIHRYFKESFNKVPGILELNTVGIDPAAYEEFWKTYKNYSESVAEAENYSALEKDMLTMLPEPASAADMIRDYSGYLYRKYNDLIASNENVQSIPTATCLPFSRKLFLTVNGKILPCERVRHQFALGFADENIVELDFEQIAAKYNGYFDKIAGLCNSCFRAKSCKQCIFHLEIDADNPVCYGWMNYQQHSEYLAGRMSYLEKNPRFYYKFLEEVNFI